MGNNEYICVESFYNIKKNTIVEIRLDIYNEFNNHKFIIRYGRCETTISEKDLQNCFISRKTLRKKKIKKILYSNA